MDNIEIKPFVEFSYKEKIDYNPDIAIKSITIQDISNFERVLNQTARKMFKEVKERYYANESGSVSDVMYCAYFGCSLQLFRSITNYYRAASIAKDRIISFSEKLKTEKLTIQTTILFGSDAESETESILP